MSGTKAMVVYGFDRYADWPLNPSQILVTELAQREIIASGWTLHTLVLPTDYGECERPLGHLIRRVKPAIVLGLGLTSLRRAIYIERFAVNIDNAMTPDNAGVIRSDQLIDPAGPVAIHTRVDLTTVLAAIKTDPIPAEISNHAGTYVCNHSYYRVLQIMRGLNPDALCLFMHLPMVDPDNAELNQGDFPWGFGELRRAVDRTITALIAQATS